MKSVIIVLIALISVAVCVGLGIMAIFLVLHSVEHRYWELRHKKTLTPSELCELEELEEILYDNYDIGKM